MAFETKCHRRITNTSWKEFKSNNKVREETKQEYVSKLIRRRRWKYIGHVLRMENTRLPQQSFIWTPEGKRGRPKETLRRTTNRESRTMNVRNTEELRELAADRQRWRAMISALCVVYDTGGI